MSDLSRRELLARGFLYGGGVAAALYLPRPQALAAAAASDAPQVFSAEEWATTEAICARLIPTDHEPGATEAGCVNFIDKALAHEDAALRSFYKEGLRGIDAVAKSQGGKKFSALEAAEQDAVLRAIEDGKTAAWPAGEVSAPDFFAQVWTHTLWGFLADSKYGGNREFAGWRVMQYPGGRHRRGGYSDEMMAGKTAVDAVWGEKGPRPAKSSG